MNLSRCFLLRYQRRRRCRVFLTTGNALCLCAHQTSVHMLLWLIYPNEWTVIGHGLNAEQTRDKLQAETSAYPRAIAHCIPHLLHNDRSSQFVQSCPPLSQY